MNIYLKVKIKSLAEEAHIIRKEERKQLERKRADKANCFFELQSHRKKDVRRECRSSHLAYGFLRGRPYLAMEAKCHTKPDWKNVERLIQKYGEGDKRDMMQEFSAWKDAAVEATD